MTNLETPDDARAVIQEALAAALRDNREWLREVVQEALVEVAHAEARREAELRVEAGRQRPYPLPHGQA